MTILNPIADAPKSVSILNSDDYLTQYAGVSKSECTEIDSMTVETLLRSIDGRLQTMDKRLDGIDTRLDKMDARLGTMDARLNSMDTRLDKMDARDRKSVV